MDFSIMDLRGQNFRGQDLSGANFTDADIRGANFTNARLTGCNFYQAKAGQQIHWTATLLFGLWLLSGVSGWFLGFYNPFLGLIPKTDSIENIIILLISLAVLAAFFTVIIRKSLAAGFITVSIFITFAGILAAWVPGAFIAAIFCSRIASFVIIFMSAIAASLAVAGSLAARITVICAITGAFVSPVFGYKGENWFLAITATILILLSTYICRLTLLGNKEDTWIKKVAITFAAIGGTSFLNADLADANFTKAILKGTNLRRANLTRTRWFQAKGLELANVENTYLQNPSVRQLVVTGRGNAQNFDRENLRGINLQSANLADASFIGADLSEANLQYADLSRAKLKQTQLDATDFTGANLTGAFIENWGITTNTKFDGVRCEYVYMRLPTIENPDPPRKPDNRQKVFAYGEFGDFIKPIFDYLELYHNQDVDPCAIAISFKHLAENHPDAKLEIVAMEKRGQDKFLLLAKTAATSDKSKLSTEYFDTYNDIKGLTEQEIKIFCGEKDDRIRSLETMVMTALQSPQFDAQSFQRDIPILRPPAHIGSGLINAETVKFEGIGGNIYNTTLGNNRAVQGKDNQAVQGDSNSVTQQNQQDTEAPLVRYPNLNSPEQTIIHQKFSLLAQLLIKSPEPSVKAIYVEDTGDPEKLPEVEVVVRNPRGFDIEGSDSTLMKVKRETDSSVEFILTPRELGEQEIRVDFYQSDRRIGTVRRNILVVDEPSDSNVTQPKKTIGIELKATPTTPPPDLELCVELRDDCTLYFTLHSKVAGYHHAKVGQVILKGSPLEKMQAVYQEMSNKAAPIQLIEQASAERRLAALGHELWDELIPEKLKQEYWRFKFHVKSILITSDEPWIPWEMIKPYHFNNEGERKDELFLCQQFALSRWLSGEGGTAEELFLGRARPVAPTQVNLRSVQEEVAFIKQLCDLRSDIIVLEPCCSYQEVLDWLENEKFFILHFACHGMFDATYPNNSAIKLSDGILRPSDIRVRFGGKRPRPLLFINACHGARSEFSFTGVGGWAERLVTKANVGAFVGAMWEVNDGLALIFARSFYTKLLKDNATIAEAFKYAREEIRQLAPYNSTWLAYVLYADPEGRIKEEAAIDNTTDLDKFRQMVYQIKAQVEREAFNEKKEAALLRIVELEESIISKEPDLDTIAYVKKWFSKNLPQHSTAITQLIVHPSVIKLITSVDDAIANEFCERFNIE
ncbi:MAG: pentapeptide repeat-containing protein [Nostoc desertorum CM1-VF14]|jgi:uncharacterized protein YjbI with pentapeptide repeats|nr:pentapeptide repeat-containing protein [Nostoc desertorum CM1-VF14]